MSIGKAVSFQARRDGGVRAGAEARCRGCPRAGRRPGPPTTTMNGSAILKNDAVIGASRAERRSFDEKARCTTRKSVVQ